jgi:hypothetical protein
MGTHAPKMRPARLSDRVKLSEPKEGVNGKSLKKQDFLA